MRQIVIRFDDICPTMDWTQWGKAERFMDERGIKPLIGVIPDCQDSDLKIEKARSDFWKWLKGRQDKGYVIAMHGVNHVFCSKHRGILTNRIGSEFAGLPYKEQLQILRRGKEMLESHGIYTDIFFAPGHSYDENTVKALAACGFKYVSDGKSSKAYSWMGIKFLPCRNSGAVFNQREQYSTSIYHAHEWAHEEKNAFPIFKEIVAEHAAHIVAFGDYKKQPMGWSWQERVAETLYVWLQFNVAPIIRRIRR